MCLKYGDDELDTVRSLMAMTLNSAIAMVFDLDIDDIELSMNFAEDLEMSVAQSNELQDLVAEYFDGIEIDLATITTVENLFDFVIHQEFQLT
jgi:hypothetical protein